MQRLHVLVITRVSPISVKTVCMLPMPLMGNPHHHTRLKSE